MHRTFLRATPWLRGRVVVALTALIAFLNKESPPLQPTPVRERLLTPTTIALVTLKAYQVAHVQGSISYAAICQYIMDLKRAGFDSNIALSGLPGDYHSSDLAAFLSEGELFGQLTSHSRTCITFTSRTLEVCYHALEAHIRERPTSRMVYERAAAALGIERFLCCTDDPTLEVGYTEVSATMQRLTRESATNSVFLNAH